MFTVRCFNRPYYLISTGIWRERHTSVEEIRQDFFLGKSNFCLSFYLVYRL